MDPLVAQDYEPTAVEGAGRLRVALCYSDCNNRGGIERVVLESARRLSNSCEVSVLSRTFPSDQDLCAAVRRVPIPGPRLRFGFGLPLERAGVERLVRNGPWDVVGGFGVQAPENSVVWVPSVHAAWWAHSRAFRKGWGRFLQTANPFHRIVLGMEKELFRRRRYRRLIALTPRVREDLGRFYDVAPESVEILPNGFAPEDFNLSLQGVYRERLRRVLGIPMDAKVVLFVANEWERKGLMPLMEALAGIKDVDVHLVVVGKMPKSFLEAKARQLGIQKTVHVVGPTGSVNRWFGMADLFALPTVYEAWGLVVVEALAAGLPVLTSQCAGASVTVREGYSGHLLPDPRDVAAIQKGLRMTLDKVAWSTAEIAASVSDYRWSQILSRYEGILRACV
jgi:UDP-glucose:(heptosyl)LPS alpha-1,3-glucosyltransferase